MPEQLFRYRCCNDLNVEAFKEDNAYAVTANKFNDPYDTLVRYDIEKIKNLFRVILRKDNLQKMRACKPILAHRPRIGRGEGAARAALMNEKAPLFKGY